MLIKGYFDKAEQPRVKLKVNGLRKSIDINPVIDTGFNDELCLPITAAIPLGLELAGRMLIELADGSSKSELFFRGWATWQGRTKPVRIFLTESSDALLGSRMMQGQSLNIDYANHIIAISEKAVAKKTGRKSVARDR